MLKQNIFYEELRLHLSIAMGVSTLGVMYWIKQLSNQIKCNAMKEKGPGPDAWCLMPDVLKRGLANEWYGLGHAENISNFFYRQER